MKKVIFSLALLAGSISVHANNFSMPSFGNNNNGFNNGSSWNMPNMNWGNGTGNGSSWSMPNMNMGNSFGNNVSNNGTSWTMPNINFGNGFSNGSNWSMPNMNWGNGNNGFNNGSNWSMPSMNWGNGTANNTANNWNMPNMNFGNNNTPNFNNAPNFNSVPHFNNAPVVKYMPPAVPTAPQFIPRLNNQKAPQAQMPAEIPTATAKLKKTFQAAEPAKLATTKIEVSTLEKIPTPSEVKGTILAPANKAMEATTK